MVCVSQDPFEGLDFDSCLQTPREPLHLLFYGWTKNFLLTTVSRSLSVDARQVLRLRLRDVKYPAGSVRITFALDSKAGKSWSMSLYATILFLLPFLLKGLVSDDVMLAWLSFSDFCQAALAPTTTDESVLSLEELARLVGTIARPLFRVHCFHVSPACVDIILHLIV